MEELVRAIAMQKPVVESDDEEVGLKDAPEEQKSANSDEDDLDEHMPASQDMHQSTLSEGTAEPVLVNWNRQLKPELKEFPKVSKKADTVISTCLVQTTEQQL